MRLEQLEEFAKIYLQYDSLVYLLPNVVPGSQGAAQKVRTKFELARERAQRKAMCMKLGMLHYTHRHRVRRLHRQIREFQTSLYDELCKRMRLRVMRGEAAAEALQDAPPSVRRAALSLHLLSAALKNETKRLSKEGAASAIVNSLCCAWEGAGRCEGCGGRVVGGEGGCAECRGGSAPPGAVLRAVGRQFEVDDLDALRKLWLQYREVALQKLRALTTAGDDLRHVPVAARPTSTDWRVIDLTLLYDHNFKLLTDTSVVHHEQLQPLIVLFSLVQQFGLERGEERAWRDAHRHASDRGSCASLVLLQRRWHELCVAARAGVLRAMRAPAAPALPPLHAALARRFPEVATRPLMSWRELVAAGRVYTDFQQRTDESSEWLAPAPVPRAPARADTDKEDDLIIVEKDIETIELRESDGESDELIIDEDDKSLTTLAQETQNIQQTIREEIQNHRELLRNTLENRIEPNPVEQSNVTVSAMDIDNVGGTSVSNTQNCTNIVLCNENIVYLYVDNNQALNIGNTVLGSEAIGDVSSNEVPSTSSLNTLDTGQSLSILSQINPESSEAMIIFEDDDSDEMSPGGDNNSGDERSDNDRCNNAEGNSVQAEDISDIINEDNTKKEAVTESQDTKDISIQIVQSDNIDHSDNVSHNLTTDEIKSKDNTNKEVTTPKQDAGDSRNQIVETNDLGKPCTDINNDANDDLHTEDIATKSKNQVEYSHKETAAESQDTECTGNQISDSNEVIQPRNDTKGVDGSIVNNDLRNEDSETQKEVSENTPNENKNSETSSKSQEIESSNNQIVESNDKESNQNIEAIDRNIMDYKKELKLEIDDNLEIRNSEASSVGDQLAVDNLRENLDKDMCTVSENIPKIDIIFSIASVETKSENEVSNDSTSHSNETANEMMVDTNVVETSTNNETDAVESNSDEMDNASNMDTTDVTPAAIDPKLLMTARIPLTRVDSPHNPLPTSLLVEDFSSHPDYNARRLGLSDTCLLKNRHLLGMCRPVSVHVGRLSRALLDRYLGGGRPARRVLLPDIEEVRRANRRLATAQVAPTPAPATQDSEDSGDAIDQPPPPVDEVTEEMPMPTEEELMNLLQRCEPPQSSQRAGFGNGRKYCCAARRHRAVNDARARLAARAGKRAPEHHDIHGATHRFTKCNCCCLHLLPGAADAALLARLARRRRRLERQANTLLHRETEQCDEDDDSGSDGDDLDVAVTNQATKKRWKKKDKQPSVKKEKQPSTNDDYLEWIRQKTLANKYFHIQAIGEETHKTKPTHTDTAHKHTETTTVQKQPVSMKSQTHTHNNYVPRVFGNIASKDDTSAVTETKAVESSCKIVSYSGKRTGKTVVKMCRLTNDLTSGGNRKRKSLDDVADTPNKITIRISPEFENKSIDDSESVSQITKDEAEKQNAQSTSQAVIALGSLEDSLKTFKATKHSGLFDNNKKAADLFRLSDSDDDDFVDRLFIDETAQKLDRTVSQNSNFDKVKDGSEIKSKSTVKQAYADVGKSTELLTVDVSEDVSRANDKLNEASQTVTKPNEDAETGTLSEKCDETLELKLLPSKKVYQKVVRPKLVSPNTSGNNHSAVVTAMCDKKDDAKNSVALTTENVNKQLSTESLKVSITNVKLTASDVSETQAGDDSDDDVQFVEATPVRAKIDPRSLLKTKVRVTPPTRPPTILEQIALLHEKGQKFIIQKVVDQETSPVYKSEPKVNQISRYIELVPGNVKTGPLQVNVVSGPPGSGPVVNLNEKLATMCSPSTNLPYNAPAKPIVNTTTRPVITVKQLPQPVPLAPKPPNLVSATKSTQNIYPMTVSKVTADANKSKYPKKIGQYDKSVITMETTTVPVSVANIKAATDYNQPKGISKTMIVSKVTADANKPTKAAQYHKAVTTMETTKVPVSAAQLEPTSNFNQPLRIGNTTIMRTPKVNESKIVIKVTPPKPEIKECIPVLTLDGTKNSADSNVNELNTNQVLSSKIEAGSVPLLTLDATTIPPDNSSINASGLVLKVSQDCLVMRTRDDMATITAVARDGDVDDVGNIDNDDGDGDGAKVDGDGALPIISNVESLAERVETIYSKTLNTWGAINSSRTAEPLPLNVREFVRGRDPTDITVLCVDASRPLLHLRGHHVLVTELEIPTQRPQYWPLAGDRPLAFDTTDAAPAPPAGGLKVRSFARLPPPDPAPKGKVYKKLCDDPLVYARVLFACPTIQWCRRVLASSAWVGLRAPSGAVHPVLRAQPSATSAGLKCDQALPALIDLVTRLNQLITRPAAAVTYHTQKKRRTPAASDVITVDSDDEASDN